MSAAPTTNAVDETLEQKHARLLKAREEKDRERAAKRIMRDVERMELAERFEGELGPEGSEFMIYDSKHLDDPLVVVKRPALVQWTKYEQSKHTPTDRYDFVAPSIVHPPLDEFNTLRQKRIGVEIAASNLAAHLMGINTEALEGK